MGSFLRRIRIFRSQGSIFEFRPSFFWKNGPYKDFVFFIVFLCVLICYFFLFGPENLTIWVKFYVESEFQVEDTRVLHPDLEN